MTVQPGGSSRGFLSIGEVLGQVRTEFADLTLSKIRFLEAEGLIEPERTTAGYRRFSPEDVSRLRYVLAAQRDHYLPLRVIKDHLDALDRGLEPAPLGSGDAPHVPRALTAVPAVRGGTEFLPAAHALRLSRAELLEAAGLEPGQLLALEEYGLLAARAGDEHYDHDALVVATSAAAMARFGLEPRHLRTFKAAADREVGLIEQVLAPLVRQRGEPARVRAAEAVRDLAALSVTLHTTLVRTGLGPVLTAQPGPGR